VCGESEREKKKRRECLRFTGCLIKGNIFTFLKFNIGKLYFLRLIYFLKNKNNTK